MISGDVGLRKPDPGIYRLLLEQSGHAAAEMLFVDDREKNVAAALALGIDSIVFNPDHGFNVVATRLAGVNT